MGGALTSGKNHQDLVDNLVRAQHLKQPEIEQVFRSVDRGHFFPLRNSHSIDTYRDTAWKVRNIHISAPCIYSQVMENIELKKGLSFLNLGSGTGYLSTMAGLMLGKNGINHGIEIFEDVVEFANERVNSFISQSEALDKFEFCRPEFVIGNCLQITPGVQYDRVYCGAACVEECLLDYLKRLIKVGGILITPVESELMLYKRLEESEWESRPLLPVAFTNLLPAVHPFLKHPVLPQTHVISLQDLCVLIVRDVLRRKIYAENPDLGLDSMLSAPNRSKEIKSNVCRHIETDSSYPEGSLIISLNNFKVEITNMHHIRPNYYGDFDEESVHSDVDVDSSSVHSDVEWSTVHSDDVEFSSVHSDADVECSSVHSDVDCSSVHSDVECSSVHSDIDCSSEHSDVDVECSSVHSDVDVACSTGHSNVDVGCSTVHSDAESQTHSDVDDDCAIDNTSSKFSDLMLDKIKMLQLPKPLLVYINRGKMF